MASVAVVHEWLDSLAGSEKVFLALAAEHTGADLFALSSTDQMKRTLELRGLHVQTGILDRPLFRRRREIALPLMPLAWQAPPTRRRAPYETVVTSHHAFAQTNALGRHAGRHLVYVHTPARYIWSPELDGRGVGFAQGLSRPVLRVADRAAVKHVTSYAANSSAVQERIRRYYERDAVVLHPPVDVDFFSPGSEDTGLDLKRDYLLSVGRFVQYKRHDLALRLAKAAGVPVVLAGHGPEQSQLRALAAELGVAAQFCISPSDKQLRALYQNALALVFLGLEDFGIVPVEAQACGLPVIGLDVGGTRDTIDPDVSGIWVRNDAPVEEVAMALERAMQLDRRAIVANAQRFSPAVFQQGYRRWLARTEAL